MSPMMRAGLPATTANGGTFLMTTAPSPMKENVPRVTPHPMCAPAPSMT